MKKKKKYLMGLYLMFFVILVYFCYAELSELQKTACNAADQYDGCGTKLESYGIVTNQQCCKELGKCCGYVQGYCEDGTVEGRCSATKPEYCDNGSLVNRCELCGCPSEQKCNADGTCSYRNTKNINKYTDKQVFLTAGTDWRGVLSLVPLTTWTDSSGEIHKYPMLVYPYEFSEYFSYDEQITMDPSYQASPSISGDKIVWRDSRTGFSDIYMYDLSTNEEKRVCCPTDIGERCKQDSLGLSCINPDHPDIAGDKVVWDTYYFSGVNWEIFMNDLAYGAEKRITTDPGEQRFPVIDGDKIVWEDWRGGYGNIYMYDLSTNEERKIFSTRASVEKPAISGDKIVWRFESDIEMYDLSTGKNTHITSDPKSQMYPDIDIDRIVWQDNRNGNDDIYMYDISTGQEKQITTNPAGQSNPAISGDRIVWEDDRNGNSDIYMYDLSTGKETQITTNPANQVNPAISGNKIVWQDYRNGNSDIYIYHPEGKLIQHEAFDADSIVHFLQQYSPDKLTVIGDTPQRLLNLLVAQPELGAGLSSSQIEQITMNDYFSFWETYGDVVYVEDNYELALLASTYASLINAPLVIQGTTLDSKNVFANKHIICVGSVDPEGAACSEQYNLEQLQQKYLNITRTDKLILVNPNDLNIYLNQVFKPKKSTSSINKLYTQTSLLAPVLASVKHQLIIGTTSTNYQDIDSFIKQKVKDFGLNPEYLTIMAAPNAIPYKEKSDIVAGYTIYRALDHTQYADFNSDYRPDIASGRIQGLTLSDVSSYVARSLFYDTFPKNNNMKFMATAKPNELCYYYAVYEALEWSSNFKEVGYNALADVHNSRYYTFDQAQWENQHLISYSDHGSSASAGIYSGWIPLLDNSLVFNDACSTCSTYDHQSFCNLAMRQGAISHLGAVSVAFAGTNVFRDTMSGIYYNNLTLGEAFLTVFRKYSGDLEYMNMITLFGDPTLELNPSHMLTKPLKTSYHP